MGDNYGEKDFYERYRLYLNEEAVRRSHDFAFAIFARILLPLKPNVMDLGCGTSEYYKYRRYPMCYAGIDKVNSGFASNLIVADYMALDFGELLPFAPDAFVSLFSIEACYPADVKYAFYEELFAKFRSLNYGLVSGFFYESKKGLETVTETGGLTSFQTIEEPQSHISGVFRELRLHLKTPSEMFGADVVEVWKFFVRQGIGLEIRGNQPKPRFKVLKNGRIIVSDVPGRYAGNRPRKIFGRLDCGSGMKTKKENRVFFLTWDDAIAEGYRPCKRCKPAPNDSY